MNRYIGSDRMVYLICVPSETKFLVQAITESFDYTVFADTDNKDLSLLTRLDLVENTADLLVYDYDFHFDNEQRAIMAYADARGMEIIHFDDLMEKLARIEEMDCD